MLVGSYHQRHPRAHLRFSTACAICAATSRTPGLTFSISGFTGGYPNLILNFPEQLRGYVYSNVSPFGVSIINYSTEAASRLWRQRSQFAEHLGHHCIRLQAGLSPRRSPPAILAVQDNQLGVPSSA